MTSGDPGACMYGFGERGVVQSEAHRQLCIDHIETECRRAAEINIAAGEDADEQHGEIESMLAYLKSAPIDGELPEMDEFTEAYVTAALYSSNDNSSEDGGEPLDSNHSPEHFEAEAIQAMISDCAHFQSIYGHLLVDENYIGRVSGTTLQQAGHDFLAQSQQSRSWLLGWRLGRHHRKHPERCLPFLQRVLTSRSAMTDASMVPAAEAVQIRLPASLEPSPRTRSHRHLQPGGGCKGCPAFLISASLTIRTKSAISRLLCVGGSW